MPSAFQKAFRYITLLAATAIFSVACTTTVPGEAHPTPVATGALATADNLHQTLPSTEYLQNLFGLTVTQDGQPKFGTDKMMGVSQNMKSGPRECLGIVLFGTEKGSYQPFRPAQFISTSWQVKVEAEESETWDTFQGAPGFAYVGVSSFGDIVHAQSAFDAFSRNWQECEGKFVTVYDPKLPDSGQIYSTATITAVRQDNSVLSATLPTVLSDTGTYVIERALGMQGNCIVETTVAYMTDGGPHAIEIARHVMETISQLG